MITSLKLFYSDSQPMLALYRPADEQHDGWECNLPATDVVVGDPAALPLEQQVSLADARKLVRFTPGFRARLRPIQPALTLGAMVSAISASTQVSEADVQMIVESMLRRLRAVVQEGDTFRSAKLLIRPRAKVAGAAKGIQRSAIVKPLTTKTAVKD